MPQFELFGTDKRSRSQRSQSQVSGKAGGNEGPERRPAVYKNLPAIGAVFRWSLSAAELISLPISKEGDAYRHEHRRYHQDENATAQSLNHARTGGCRLGITEGAVLGEAGSTKGDHRNDRQGPSGEMQQRANPWVSHDVILYFANGLMCSSRKLSDHIMFIMSTTKMVAGMSASRRFRCSSRRCIKYITARPA